MKLATILILGAFFGAPGETEDPATKKEVAELRQEVKDLRRMLARIMEIEEQRLAALKAVLGEQSIASSAATTGGDREARRTEPAAPESTSKPAATAGRGGGTVTGKVTVTGVANPTAFVFIEDIPGRLVTGKTVEVKQVEKKFVPSAIAVQKGTKVVFPNLDKIFHNVFSVTPGASFDLGSYAAGAKAGAYTFTQPGVVDVFCNLHSQMTASVLVVPNAHYARVGGDGRFKLENVPAGKHKLVAWTPNSPQVSEAITVVGGQDVEVNLSIAGRDGVPEHKNKKGMPYGSYE